ncbi:hypothetical protein S7711_04093 [Stachybotrys chartarum IBT 7711]|uniref:Kelch repeat protein n=1 Tax=Stachybotrys chartarum (strain CBS 109288 / IBT 7711) TaxID=1280523 RepID=A0A084AR46_STACB|nr:hypothetical protein S7711_04093 [Stachybotrys chartarum IBT 7711]
MRHLNSCRALLAASLVISICLGQDEVPSVQTFKRRGNSVASIIGHYIYFDGGEVAQEGYVEERVNNPANATLSIDLSTSWTPEDVEIRELSKPAAMIPMVKQSVFTDKTAEIFYVWGGISTADVGDPVLWHFEPDGEGGGSWTTEAPGASRSTSFRDAERVESGAYVSTKDAAFVFGGLSNEHTSLEPKGNVAGYVAFNFTTQEWNRESSGPYSSDATLYGATATFMPDFGPNGLIIVLGGVSQYGDEDAEYIDFRTVHLFDPIARDWHSQVTTGEAPSARNYHCTAGVASITLQWRNEYNASAEAYISHSGIREWYEEGRIDEVNWSSDEVQQLFVLAEQDGDGSAGKGTNSEGNGEDNETEDPTNRPIGDQDGSGSSTTPIGAMIGGVIGGAIALLILGFAVWCFRKRRREMASAHTQTEAETRRLEPFEVSHMPELHGHSVPELHGYSTPAEMKGDGDWLMKSAVALLSMAPCLALFEDIREEIDACAEIPTETLDVVKLIYTTTLKDKGQLLLSLYQQVLRHRS